MINLCLVQEQAGCCARSSNILAASWYTENCFMKRTGIPVNLHRIHVARSRFCSNFKCENPKKGRRGGGGERRRGEERRRRRGEEEEEEEGRREEGGRGGGRRRRGREEEEEGGGVGRLRSGECNPSKQQHWLCIIAMK